MLNHMEKTWIQWNNTSSAAAKYWDRMTENGKYPERMSLSQAQAICRDYEREISAE